MPRQSEQLRSEVQVMRKVEDAHNAVMALPERARDRALSFARDLFVGEPEQDGQGT